MKRILKWLGIILGGLIVVVVILVAALHYVGSSRLNNAPDVTTSPVTVPSDEEAVARGEHLATISSCADCHGDGLGGTVFVDESPIGYVPAPNLTAGAGGIGDDYADEDWERAIRHGVAGDGRTMVIMATAHYAHYGDQDLGDLIAYLKSVPPVDNELGPRRIAFPGTIIFGMLAYGDWGVNQIAHEEVGGPAPDAAATAEYGQYLVNIASCGSCHGENMAGGTDPEAPRGPNITRGGDLQNWSEEAFITTLRTGVTPDGRQLSEEMPWRNYTTMTDTELQALWAYLQSVPALPDNESNS